MRRVYPGYRPRVGLRLRQRPGEEAPLADPDSVVKHFGKRSRRPASARQLAIERRVTRGQNRLRRMLELATAPYARQLRKLRDRDFHYPLPGPLPGEREKRFRMTPTAMPSMVSVSRFR